MVLNIFTIDGELLRLLQRHILLKLGVAVSKNERATGAGDSKFLSEAWAPAWNSVYLGALIWVDSGNDEAGHQIILIVIADQLEKSCCSLNERSLAQFQAKIKGERKINPTIISRFAKF